MVIQKISNLVKVKFVPGFPEISKVGKNLINGENSNLPASVKDEFIKGYINQLDFAEKLMTKL